MTNPTRRRYLATCLAGGLGSLAGCSSIAGISVPTAEKVDDWQYDSKEQGGRAVMLSADLSLDVAESSDSLGLAAGGAADIGTFRRNVYEGYLPIPESMAVEGLFHEYYFDTAGDESCTSLFCPTYTPAVSTDPLSDETEHFLSLGLDSGLAATAFNRPPLNLVVVLDISGSMNANFNEYYYDAYGNEQRATGDMETPKIDVAKDVLVDLTRQLRPDDRLGVVLFNNESAIAKPLRTVDTTDMDAIRGHIQEDIQAGGGTNISEAMDDAEELYTEALIANNQYEHRMLLLTDAQINRGETDATELRTNIETRADTGIHTTVVGIGVDFNADLIDQITSVRGANYYSVYSGDEFEQRLVEEFEYMVTPLVFDLSLALDADGFEIEQVYGSPSADEATGEVMHVHTLFPSPSDGDAAKGGVVLVQLMPTGGSPENRELELVASWERRDGSQESAVESLTFPDDAHYYGNDAVRKAVLLARYATLMQYWTVDERVNGQDPIDASLEPPAPDTGKWELQSDALTVSRDNAERMRIFREHLLDEAAAIGDESLDREHSLLDEILAAAETADDND